MRTHDSASAGGPGDAGGSQPADGRPAADRTRPDVFLSYAREDADRAEWAFRILTARGWSVWFDRELVGGDRWRKLIDETLDEVPCVVVLWSSASVMSNWVMDEAGEGMGRNVLVPALLEDVEIPIGFREAQAVDLVEPRVPRYQGEAALVAAVGNVLGRPPVEPPKPSRLGRLLRREAPLAGAIVPLVVGLPFLLRPAPATVIDLNVTATEAGYVSTREQDLTDLMVVSSFDADGLASIHWPRTRTTDERVVSAADSRGLGLRLGSIVGPPATGSITLESIRVDAGTRVVVTVADSQSTRMSLAGTASPIVMSVDGVLPTGLTGGDTELLDFGTPKRLMVEPDPRGADLVARGLAADGRLVSSSIQVEELSLVRIDQTLGTTRTELAVVSTIRSGTVRLDAPDGPERPIGAGELLRLGGSAGEIRELALEGGVLRMRFLGGVHALDSCTSDDDCESWMPSRLESLVARRLPGVLAIAAIHMVVLVILTRRRLGWPGGRLTAIALAFCAAGPTGASPLGAVQAPDAEESVKRLVVRVESAVGFGSGILVGTRSDTLFVVTANHVVRRGATAADTVDVRFYWQPDVPVQATLLPDASDALDLALLAVSPLSDIPAGTASSTTMDRRGSTGAGDPDSEDAAAAGRALGPGMIPFDRLGNLAVLERGDPIWLLGQPNGLPWRINTSPERFIEFRGESLDFESNLLARGHSGGALLNEDREVIGMLKSDQAPYGEAVGMYAIARQLEAWGYPVDLKLRAPQIAAAEGRTCVLSSRGQTRCVGYDDRYEPGPIDFAMRLKRLSIRDDHACGIVEGGRAFCVGNNSNGQLGDGTTVSRYEAPVEVAGGLVFESISAGSGHTCGVISGGDVYCWGLAEGGQLGTDFVEDRTTPTRVPTTERFRSVSAMWQYTCGLTTAGGAWCWGALAARTYLGSPPTTVAPDLRFTSLTAGWYQVCAITPTGQAFCWGFNDDGQLGIGTSDDEFHEEPLAVSGNLRFTSISSGVGHVCGVTVGGEIWCWGLNNYGQLGNGATESSALPVRVVGGHVFEAVSAGNLHTCGLTTGGEVWCWGDNGIVGSHEGGGVRPGGEERYTTPVLTMTLEPDERRPWRR